MNKLFLSLTTACLTMQTFDSERHVYYWYPQASLHFKKNESAEKT